MQNFWDTVVEISTTAGSKIILALLIFIIGRIVIDKILKLIGGKPTEKLDPTVRSFALNSIKAVLYIILLISIISVLGVPMASVITVLATCGVAIGMSLQGALSNVAGGIMLMIFRPFNVGDYVSAGGAEGVVKDISLFYTTITTTDNKVVTVPNGALMNANVTNFSTEKLRRVDLTFSCAKGEDIAKIQDLIIGVMKKNPLVLEDPAPFARLSGGTNEGMEFTVRAWTESANYWDTYFALTQEITEELGKAGVKAPATRIINIPANLTETITGMLQ